MYIPRKYLQNDHTLLSMFFFLFLYRIFHCGGARGVMVILAGNGHGDTCSNPGRD